MIRTRVLSLIAGAAFVAASLPALSADRPNERTYWDIQSHLGVVPKFFHLFPELQVPFVWNEFKSTLLDNHSALDAKTKELIAMAASARVGCAACLYFHAAAATANGATGKEIQEAIALEEMVGTWAKVLTPNTVDMVRTDTNTLVSIGKLTFPKPVTN